MATRAAMVAREAEINRRQEAAVGTLVQRFAVELPPPFPPVRDPAYRALDEREWLAIALERIVEATAKE